MAVPRHALGAGSVSVRWADPFLLHLIPLLPALVGIGLLLWWRRRREVGAALGDPALVRRLTGTDLRRFPVRRAALLLPAAALLGVAAAGPRWGPAAEPDGTRGDVVLVLDASNSMLAEDVRPSRLEAERAAARALVDRLGGGRVGLVAFGGSGHVLSPLTTDGAALHLYLDALSPEIVNQSGTSLYAALRQALGLLGPESAGGPPGSIVLVSDGEALDPPRMVHLSVQDAARRGVPIHTVAIGTAAGAPVPDVDPLSGKRIGYKREPNGLVATSRLDAATLQRIARETGGTFTRSTDAGAISTLAAAAARGGRATRARGESLPDNRYRWPLALALLLIVADALAERGRARREG
ncbi:vWA domain-containing protein [Longimicrobium sp.]|uniref:vWA domain-containing protein n=1 Tax=Longimicrobium sp. TaxID=2029185 RepID=UPI002E349A7F|nr:VWA domain-containing protein [Longimicrobium sp.]HEX6040974.1 VWA domain-containing protein [Longimicrobium sp.]